jgi:hypothetical protein
MTNINGSKSSAEYYCKYCDYISSRKSQYERHVLTAKHKIRTNTNKKVPKSSKIFCCDCGKEYKHASSLWNHKQKCNHVLEKETKQCQDFKGTFSENAPSNYKDMFLHMVDEKNKLKTEIFSGVKDMLVDIIPKLQPNTTNTTNNTNIININMFLNEQCKDAMNIGEFIESIQLTIEDISKIGQQGQTNGMSNILIDKLNEIDVFKRPVHCSDVKKETIYVKDQDKWEEEKKDRPKIKRALDKLAMKSIEAMPSMNQDPDDYVKTVAEVLKDPREDKKIISRLAKGILL